LRALIQRVAQASVTVGGQTVATIQKGMVILLGVGLNDTEADAHYLAERTANLRIFPDASGKFNVSLLDSIGEALVVSQFTLYANTRKGRRPSFTHAAPPDMAEPLIETFTESLRDMGVPVRAGIFGEHMLVEILNDGPVTMLIDSDQQHQPRH
jgi:D-tyrosyl-tRNA(Tyr) deacylase